MIVDGLELYSGPTMVVDHFTLHPGGCNDSGRPRTLFLPTMVVDHFTLDPDGCKGSVQPCRWHISKRTPLERFRLNKLNSVAAALAPVYGNFGYDFLK